MKKRMPLIAALLVVGVVHLNAATIPVTSTADNGAAGTLRAALASAANGDTIDATGVSGTILLTSGELLVTNNLTIAGPGPNNLAVNGNSPNTTNRVFHIGSNTVVSIASLTITNGTGTLVDDFFTFAGGGIWNEQATLTVSNCTLSGNSATNGGGIYNDGEGGSFNAGRFVGSASLQIVNSTLSGNSAFIGGGIYNNHATLTVSNCTLSGNLAGYGGGLWNAGYFGSASVEIENSTVSGNDANSSGGGIYNGYTVLTIRNSTISGNSAGDTGGGVVANGHVAIERSTINDNSAARGGGIVNNNSSTLTVRNSTLSGNSAGSDGGGILNFAPLIVSNCTISGNSAGSAGGIFNFSPEQTTVANSIIAVNTGGDVSNAFGTADISNHNFIGDTDGDPMLGSLADNGGPTLTMALLPGSPCINAGDPLFTGPPDYDQRGATFERVRGAAIDIGAFEAVPVVYQVDNTGDVSDGDYSHLHLTLREAIELANASPGNNEIRFDPAVFGSPQTINLTGALPALSTDIGIRGPGANLLTVRRDTGGNYRIFTISSGYTVGISGMTIANGSGNNGGGILNYGTVTIQGSTLSGNSNADLGGAIYNIGGTVTIQSSTLSGNSAFSGGAILNEYGNITINNSTLSGNSADGFGGGAILGIGGTVTISNSTISDNHAPGYDDQGVHSPGAGGGIYDFDGTLIITVNNSIVALNTAESDPNIAGSYTGSFNFIGGDPLLGPLQDNGGPTLTRALLPGSPCINAGNPAFAGPLIYDQRGTGYARVSGWVVDIGAFEYVTAESLVVTTTADENNSTSDPAFGTGTSLREAISWANLHPGTDTITFNLGAGAHTINLAGALPRLSTDMDIQGPGANLLTVRRDTGGDYVVFIVNATFVTPVVALSGMTIADGINPNDIRSGGGITCYSGGLSVTRCTLSGNADSGIANSEGIVVVTDSTLSGNGDGIDNYNDGFLTVINSTLSGNGLGILSYTDRGAVTVKSSTISDNFGPGIDITGGSLTVGNSIIAKNAGGDLFNDVLYGTVTSLGYNLSSDDGGGFLTATGDQINTDPLLGPLQDNGGPTFTHALLCDSPAIDKGYNFSASATDQRGAGFARTFDDSAVANATDGDGTDIGAFERQTACNNAPVARCHDVTVSAGAHCTAGASINNDSSDPDAGDTITLSQDPPGPYGLGTTLVTLTVTDNHGASSSCSAHVTVVDTTPPQINCPANIVTDATSPAGAVVNFAPTASDNCSVASVISTPSSGSTFAIGTTTVTCRATDGAGLTSSCTFTIRVNGAADADHDGVADAIDQCSDTPRGAIVNAKGCSIAQLVPCDGPLSGGKWKSHGQYVRAVVETATDFLKARLITRRQWVEIVTRAAWSKCGWNHHRDHDGDRDWHRDWDCDRDRDWGRGRDWGRD